MAGILDTLLATRESSKPMPAMTLEQLTQEVDRLPPLPHVVVKVSQLLEKPEVRAEELADLIRLDPELTAQLLRLCNSAYYGFRREITSIKEAVAILGFKTLKSMVYAILSHQVLDAPMEGYLLDRGSLWLNALTGAEYARHLAKRFDYKDPDTAFTAAILRDLGKIVLSQHIQQDYRQLENYSRDGYPGFEQAEKAILGFSHTEVGQQLAEKWHFPQVLTLAIGYHHLPSSLPPETSESDRLLVTLIHLADSLCMMMGVGVGSDGLMYPVDMAALSAVGIQLNNELAETLISELLPLQGKVRSLSSSVGGGH